MAEKIVVVHCASTGMNYIDDIRGRGYEPVIVKVDYAGTEEDKALTATQDLADSKRFKGIQIIPYNPDYQVMLRQVRECSPVLILAGSEFGVELALRFSCDLGLPSNPRELLPAMTRKDAMHEALRRFGIRYIRGKVVSTMEDAIAFYETLGSERAVVKRTRGFGTQGVTLCSTREEFLKAMEKELGQSSSMDGEKIDIMVQERIMGQEYIVNTVTCHGEHFVSSIWKYKKVLLPNGTNAYSSLENVTRMDIGYTQMVNYAFDVLKAIGIQCGPVHAEYIIDENGPVLIEINCRPMGGAFDRKFLEKLYGHHETDLILDSFLHPEGFKAISHKIYEPIRKGCLKIFILNEDMHSDSAPIISLCERLRSYYGAIFDRVGRDHLITRTHNLETNGGYVYLVHDDEWVVEEEKNLLHHIEMQYPKLLFQNTGDNSIVQNAERDITAVLQRRPCSGRTLIVTDRPEDFASSSENLYASVISREDIANAYNSYSQVVLDFSRPESYLDLEILLRDIFEAFSRVHPEGRVLIPQSTYCRMPYGESGMEILMMTANISIEIPDCSSDRTLSGRVR